MSSVGSPRESFAIQFAISYVLHMVDLKRELTMVSGCAGFNSRSVVHSVLL